MALVLPPRFLLRSHSAGGIRFVAIANLPLALAADLI